jgi:Lrp/AsnC family transcriptional regulator, leucine-responsive regulatory protein
LLLHFALGRNIDFKILRVLGRDGRITNLDLAAAINLSTAPTLRRVKRLEQTGVIKGYAAILDPTKVGLGAIVFVTATLDYQTAAAAQTFEEAVRGLPQVLECHQVAGEFDYLLKIAAPDLESYQRFATDVITSIPVIAHIRTLIPMRHVKTDVPFPI